MGLIQLPKQTGIMDTAKLRSYICTQVSMYVCTYNQVLLFMLWDVCVEEEGYPRGEGGRTDMDRQVEILAKQCTCRAIKPGLVATSLYACIFQVCGTYVCTSQSHSEVHTYM